MSVALYLRRFKADDLPTSAEAAIEALPDACPPDRRRAEEESRVLMNLGNSGTSYWPHLPVRTTAQIHSDTRPHSAAICWAKPARKS